jgi:3-oxoacyl-[acyl-carrier-protein] synthase III
MAIFKINRIAIKGISAAVPKEKESNLDYQYISESERKLLIKTTGVKERRIANDSTTTSDLCYVSAKQLIKACGTNKDDIEVIIFISQSSDYYLPATAVILQDRLGLSKNTLAFDIGLGCSGYIYGLSVISGLMQSMQLKKGLLLVGDISTLMCSKEDKSTYPLFGDAGAATLLETTEDSATSYFNLMSDGSGFQNIIIPDGGLRNKLSEDSFKKRKVDSGIIKSSLNLSLDGLNVFNFAIREVPVSIKNLFENFNLSSESTDYFIMHQANKLMNETIRKKLNFTPEQTPYSLDRFGNTSSASIPLTMVTELRNEIENRSLKLLLSGFGVGLSWGNAYIETRRITCLPLIEV